MEEDITGRTLTEELCFMLFFGLNRGKRHFLMTGGLPSGTGICNKEEHDWWHRETWCTGQTGEMTSYFCKGANKANALNIWKAEEEIQCADRHQRTYAWNTASRRGSHPHHLRFFLFLLYCTEETLFLFFFGWLWGVQHNSIWASPESKKINSIEPDVPTENVQNL